MYSPPSQGAWLIGPSGVYAGMGWDVVSWWRKCARAACVDEGARELLLLASLPPGPLLESPLLSVPRHLVRPRFVPYDSILEKQSNSPKECHISGESIHPMSFPCGTFSLTSLPLPLCMPNTRVREGVPGTNRTTTGCELSNQPRSQYDSSRLEKR